MRNLLATTLMLVSLSSQAEFMSGNELYNRMLKADRGDVYSSGYVFGYIAGITDTGGGFLFCPPPTATMGQLTDMVKANLVKFPEQRHKTADNFVVGTFAAEWPCPKKGNQM